MTSSKRASCAKPWSSMLTALSIVIVSALMTGCSTTSTQPLQVSPPPADLAAPCPDLPELADGSSKTVALWIVDAAEQYRDCAARQAGLVRAWPAQTFSSAIAK